MRNQGKTSVRTAKVSVEIRIEHLPKTSNERYYHANTVSSKFVITVNAVVVTNVVCKSLFYVIYN